MIRPIFCLLPLEYSRNLRVGSTSSRSELSLGGAIDAAAQVGEIVEGLAARQLVVQRELTRQVAKALVDRDRILGRFDAKDRRRATRWPDMVEQRPDHRGLAGAVGSEEPKGFAL